MTIMKHSFCNSATRYGTVKSSLRDWQGAGVLDLIHFALLAQEGLKTANE
jgi:hypothetical protein